MKIIQHSVPARVALAGNPSDGYQGKTLALAIGNFHAHVRLIPWDRLEIVLREQDKNRFDSINDLVDDVTRHGYYDGIRLIKASIKCFVDYARARTFELHPHPFSIGYSTTIPQGVGLSGSSAIIVATLRSLMDYYSVAIDKPVLASLARFIENDELGISAGYQDRVAQVYGGLTFMDFSAMAQCDGFECGTYESLDAALLPPLYVAYDEQSCKPSSGRIHSPLRERMEREPALFACMQEIAAQATLAKTALLRGDWDGLNQAINHNFDLRCQLYEPSERHVRMIETARSVGVSANFAGSGGAIVGCYARSQQDAPAALAKLTSAMSAACPAWHVQAVQVDPAV